MSKELRRSGFKTRLLLLVLAPLAALLWQTRPPPGGPDLDPLKPQGLGAPAVTGTDMGERARAPQDFPPRGWLAIAKRTGQKFTENELMAEAAGVTFFALLSLFPALTAVVSIFGLFANPATIQDRLADVTGFLPSGGVQIIQEQVKRLTASPSGGLTAGVVFGVLTAVWSANQGAKAMLSALNDVYGEQEKRGYIKLTATSLAFTVGGVLALLIALAAILVLPLGFQALGVGAVYQVIAQIARWPVLLVGLVGGLSFLYRFGPSRNYAKWRWVTWGGAAAAIGWLGLSYGFSWYVEHFGNYNKTYGSLGAVIGFMTWIWLSCTVLLIGAQLNAEMETQTDADSTVSPDKPIGARGAAAADHKS